MWRKQVLVGETGVCGENICLWRKHCRMCGQAVQLNELNIQCPVRGPSLQSLWWNVVGQRTRLLPLIKAVRVSLRALTLRIFLNKTEKNACEMQRNVKWNI